MTTLTKYAIRRKSDGFYIPIPRGRNGRGGSHAEPEDPTSVHIDIRLFSTEAGAKIALNAWLKGIWVTKREGYIGGPPDWESEISEETTIHPVKGRNKDDMEVVPVQVVLPAQSPEFKPTYKLVEAVFIGDGVLFGQVTPDHPHYEQDKVIKCSEIVRRIDRTKFETKNSIYDVEFVPNGETTIPERWTYFDADGMFCNADGTRSIFDDVDE